jgi:hypothetical protein
MKQFFLLVGLAVWLISCGDNAGTTDTTATDTVTINTPDNADVDIDTPDSATPGSDTLMVGTGQ